MKKTFLAIIFMIGVSFGVENNKRTDALDSIAVVNVATSDTTVPKGKLPIKCIFADVGGIVKMDMKTGGSGDTITVVRYLNDAIFYPISNVIKVYPLYNGTDSTTCQVYNSDGALVRGIGLGF